MMGLPTLLPSFARLAYGAVGAAALVSVTLPANASPIVGAFETRCLVHIMDGSPFATDGLDILTAEELGRDPAEISFADPPVFYALEEADLFLGVIQIGPLRACVVGSRTGDRVDPGVFVEMAERAGLVPSDPCEGGEPFMATGPEPTPLGTYVVIGHSNDEDANSELMAFERMVPAKGSTCGEASEGSD